MQKQNNQRYLRKIIKVFIQELITIQFEAFAEEDKYIQKFILNQVVPLGNPEGNLIDQIKEILTDPEVHHPKKYLPLLYISLIDVDADKISDLFKFYYELTSHAIKQLKEGKVHLSNPYWENILEKIYQYGMLLLIGSRSILLNVQSLGMRVNSQLFSSKAKDMRLSRLFKVYNCILCIPQKYLTLKQTLYLTLIFTRWQLHQNSLFTPSFFANFTLKTQKKLIRKLKNYPQNAFNQQHILNLIKIILGGDELVFSYYLQIKYTYQALKLDNRKNSFNTDISVFESLKKCHVNRQSRHLFNFIIQLLVNLKNQQILQGVERQSIIFVCLKYLSGKFENNQNLYVILVKHLLHQNNPTIFQMSFRFIRQQALQYLTVHKIKLLLNVFNIQNWGTILKQNKADQAIILNKLERILTLLDGIARKYSQSSLVLYCTPNKYAVSIAGGKGLKSIVLVCAFDGIGMLNQTNALQMKILKIMIGKDVYEIIVNFTENIQNLRIEASPQSKERSASLIIRLNNKQEVNQRKQYLRFSQGCYESFIAMSLSEKSNSLAFCIDGAYYEFPYRKGQITLMEIGCMLGSIRNLYVLKTEMQLINFYKNWCQSNRKTKYVIQGLGSQNIAYKLNNREDLVIVDNNKNGGFSFFQSKTEIKVNVVPVKHITFIDILLQLGGLETVFFILERFSRSLMQFNSSEQKINVLIANLFKFLKIVGVLDESNSLLSDIGNCFKYLNEFLFLLIKRNKIVRQSKDSFLIMSIFQLLVYFRKTNYHHIPSNTLEKMTYIETNLILKTLVNFQIWSHCSTSLQLFVLSQIEVYIKQKKHCQTLIKQDLHKQLLSGLVLFQTSKIHVSYSPQIQSKIVSLCTLLYQHSRQYLIQSLQLNKSQSQKYATFVDRDLSTCFTLVKFLLSNFKLNHFSQSEKSAYKLLIKYIIQNFARKTILFELIGKSWHSSISILCNCIEQMQIIDRQILCSTSYIIVTATNQEEAYDIWLLRYIQSIIFNERSTFNDCFYIFAKIMEKYMFQTTRKYTIINRMLVCLKSKLLSSQWRQKYNNEVKATLMMLSHAPLYHLSCQEEFIQLYLELHQLMTKVAQIKDVNESNKKPQHQVLSQIHQQQKDQGQLEQGFMVWNTINSFILQLLYKQRKITNCNAKFVSILLRFYCDISPFKNSEHQSLNSILQRLSELKQKAKQSHKNINNPFITNDIRSTFALIQHCRGWQTISFLMKNGLLTIENDLNIPYPYLQKQEELSSICGTVGYYLSHNPSPLQLFILFNIILYRQLSNNITILTTQANIAIFQYSIQYLIDQCDRKKSSLNEDALWIDIGVLLVILKDLIKLLNNSFIYKTALICKDIDKLLGQLISKKGEINTWKNKKSNIILENLCKALQKIQIALQDTKIDKDISVFIDFISCKISLTHEKQHKNEIISIIFSLVEDLKTKNWIAHQQQFKKLHILGIKFFKIAREYYLSKNAQYIFDLRTDKKYNEKIQDILPKQKQLYFNYWSFLTQNFDNILQELNDRGNESQKIWQNLLITNQHWFELQQDLNDVTTKFYQLDQKQTGPFGFYKLNIRPVLSNHQKLPYPRKKQYSEMISKKQKFQKQKEQSLACQRSTIQLTNTTLFSTLAQSRQKSTLRLTQKYQNQKMIIAQKEYFCEYVTKRGVYAGVICKKKDTIQFRFTGYDALPPDKVYQTSTNKCHRIQKLSQWEEKEIKFMKIRLSGSKIFTRRYILRHTAFEIFHNVKHRSYFFNLFFNQPRQNFLYELKSSEADVVQRRPEQFAKSGYTERWRKGQISNFEYLGLINRYSGRTTNDLVQYYVMPWVIANYNGQNNYKEVDKEFYKNLKNLRDLTLPTGKLNPQKFNKLKARLIQVDASDRQIRFLYGTMYSNPTVLYNFFIRLEPYTSLHWQHQGRKIDHADRLFSGVYQQFNTILTSSSDMKELAPEFYYWTEFLRNRNRIDLGTKQKGDDVDAVVLPVWARSPQEFIFKMREALQSNYTSTHLHEWIDLIFGYKTPLSVAEQHDNLYHFQCYEHDLFQDYQTQNEMKIAQIAISEFGQVAEQVFMKQHPPRYTRKEMNIDIGIIIHKNQKDNNRIIGFQLNEAGIMMWNQNTIIFKKVAISGLYNSFEWTKDYQNKSKLCILTSINFMKWLTLSGGVMRMYQKGKVKMQKQIESKCLDVMGNYIFYSCGSKIVILQIKGQIFQLYNTLYGHRDQVITIKTDFILDLIVSVDRSGYVLIHELTQLRFLRAFQLGTNFQGQQSQKLRVCIHRMGYFIFLDHEQTLWIFNYMGELILQQDIEIRTVDNKQDEEKVTEIQIFSHQHSLLLLSSNKGSIFLVNFLDIIRFKETYPYKTFSRVGRNLLDGVRSKTAQNFHGKAIRQFTLVKTVGQKSAIYQLIVLYETNELVCYTEQRQMGQQLKTNPRLKSMGFF